MLKLSIVLVALLAPALAFAQQPNLTTLGPIVGTDIARAANEVDALLKLAQSLEARAAQAAYWEDACKSTPECGGK